MPHYDLFVIGGGSGGVAGARTSAALGLRLAWQRSIAWGGPAMKQHLDWVGLRNGVQAELRRLNTIYDGLLEKFNVQVHQESCCCSVNSAMKGYQ